MDQVLADLALVGAAGDAGGASTYMGSVSRRAT